MDRGITTAAFCLLALFTGSATAHPDSPEPPRVDTTTDSIWRLFVNPAAHILTIDRSFDQSRHRFGAVVENDALWVSPVTDRNYTNGVQLSYLQSQVRPDIDNNFGFGHLRPEPYDHDFTAGVARTYGFRVGQTIFTPEDTTKPAEEVTGDDRPYAGIAYIGFDNYFFATTRGINSQPSITKVWHYAFDLGCFGSCAKAGKVQNWFHEDVSNDDLVKGWNSQMKSDLFAQVRLSSSLLYLNTMSDSDTDTTFAMDLDVRWRGEIGTVFNRASIEPELRIGFLSNQFNARLYSTDPPTQKNFQDAYTQSQIASPQRLGSEEGDDSEQNHLIVPHTPPSELYVFAKASPTVVAYNGTLEGGLIRRVLGAELGDHTVSSRPFVTRFEYGAAFNTPCLSLEIARIVQSTEIAGKPFELDEHHYGRVKIELSFSI